MTPANKPAFFAKINPLDVMPRIDEATLPDRFHVSHWELRNRAIVGKSIADSWGIKPTEYGLREAN